MNLSKALAAAKRYTDDLVTLKDGIIFATNGRAGIEIAVDGLKAECTVDCDGLLRMVKAIGADCTLTLAKGRKLKVTGGASSFQIQAVPDKKTPPYPKQPKKWVDLTAEQVNAISALVRIAEPENAPMAQIPGIRLHPRWVAAGQNWGCGFAWAAGLVEAPVTTPASLWRDLSGPARLHVDKRRVWLATEGEVRWAQLIAGDWPDEHLESVINSARGDTEREAGTVSLPELLTVLKQATVIGNRGTTFALTGRSGGVEIVGGDTSGAHGAQAFAASVPCAIEAEGKKVGFSPTFATCVAAAAQVAEDGYLSLSGTMSPVVVWGGDPVVEVLAMPAYLTGGK